MNKFKIPANSIIIAPDNLKKALLKSMSKDTLSNIKVITLTEVRQKFYFNYDERAIYYLMEKYNYVIDVAKMYLSKLYEVNDNPFNSPKIQKIIDLKQELISNNLLKYSPNFIQYLKNKTIFFYECNNIDTLDKKMLNEISKLCKTEYINQEKQTYLHKYIYEFNTIDDEVVYVATEICSLVKKGISFNKIKLCGISGEYPSLIQRIFKWYHIPISFQDNFLYSTAIAKDFLEHIDEKGTETIKYLEENYNLTNQITLDIYNQIIRILNKYAWAPSYLKVKALIETDLKNTVIEADHYQEEVEIINSLNSVTNDDYVFLLGFNQGDIPKTYKDESYFNDTLKNKLGLETTNELNQRNYQQWLTEINNTKNITITAKLTSSIGVHYLSSLNDDLNLEIKKPKLSYNYSNLHNQLLLGEKIDNFIKYGEKQVDLELLYSNYPNICYQKYCNDYKPINIDKLKKYLNNHLVLSYSSMNTYYQCGFRYYLSNILKLNIFEETFYTVLGNLFHYILSIAFKKEIDLKKEYYEYLAKCNYPFNSREKFFLSNLEKELEFIIQTIKKQNEVNSLDKTYFEEKIEVDKSKEDLTIIFKGYIDKIMTNENKDIIAIIDYKTGNPDLNLNNIIYGLDLQLPVYIYLAKKKFPNSNIAGFYLQKILNNEISKDYKHTYEFLKEDKLKLQGYSNSNTSILEKFDASYNESKMIKGMRTTSKGLGTKKVLRSDQIQILETITENKIDESLNKILNAEFQINPKRIGMNNLGCNYCKFKDICFFTERNIKNLKEYKNMEFLGGEEDDTEETC